MVLLLDAVVLLAPEPGVEALHLGLLGALPLRDRVLPSRNLHQLPQQDVVLLRQLDVPLRRFEFQILGLLILLSLHLSSDFFNFASASFAFLYLFQSSQVLVVGSNVIKSYFLRNFSSPGFFSI